MIFFKRRRRLREFDAFIDRMTAESRARRDDPAYETITYQVGGQVTGQVGGAHVHPVVTEDDLHDHATGRCRYCPSPYEISDVRDDPDDGAQENS